MKNSYKRILVSLLSACLLATSVGVVAESDTAAAGQVMNSYLVSLASGDTQGLMDVLDEKMIAGNRQLTLDPEYYGNFLQTHYADVGMTVEAVEAQGEFVEARVRFDYPASPSSVITFVLVQVAGEWKVGGEIF